MQKQLTEAWGPKADPLGLGKTAETMLKELRKRAGIDSADPYLGEMASAGKDEFRQLVQNERRIELCFENHRFFDVRQLDASFRGYKYTSKGGYNSKKR